jgi:uncharacterized integral membrane protein
MIGRVIEAYRRYLERNRIRASQFWFMILGGALIIFILILYIRNPESVT